MKQDYDFITPLSRMYKADQTSVKSLAATRNADGGLIIAEAAAQGAGVLAKVINALSQHKRDERKLLSQLRGVGHAIEADILGKIDYGLNMLNRLQGFYQFVDYSLKHPDGSFIFELADRIRAILELDDSFEYTKSSAVWDSQKDFLFKHGKEQIVRRVANFYNMIQPKLVQIEQEKNNVFKHFGAFLEELSQVIEHKQDRPSEMAVLRLQKTLQALDRLASLYADLTLHALNCLTG